ncbi:hypothetical protein [Virgisporangium ochraceum]|uniref:hypothetical protein n=1 Tax=Virgisporangium ochraceum TaxID=65505 RepID=UPI0019424B3C|nr:hypothetical protein [Virgisporangium ochraceum]
MARRDPQEKKALSYARDRRNAYGENDKSSRRNIRRNKRIPNRVDRHRDHQVLTTAVGRVVPELAESAEVTLLATTSRWISWGWRKSGDAPLADVVEYKLRRRVRLGMADEAATQARIERIRRRTR